MLTCLRFKGRCVRVRVHAKSWSNRVPRVRYVLHLQSCFIFQTTLWAKSCCHPHFINGETEAQRAVWFRSESVVLVIPLFCRLPSLHREACHLCTWEALGAKAEDGWFPRMLRFRAVKSLGMLDQAWGELGPHMEEKRAAKRNTFVRGDARQEVPCLSPEGTRLSWLKGTVRNG